MVPTSDTAASQADGWIVLARVLMVMLFVMSGMQKMGNPGELANLALVPMGIPFPVLAVWLVLLFELFGSICILLGWRTRLVAIAFTAYILILGPLFHQFWHYSLKKDGLIAQMMKDDFFHHTTMAGGFVLLAVFGPGRYSLDARRPVKHPSAIT